MSAGYFFWNRLLVPRQFYLGGRWLDSFAIVGQPYSISVSSGMSIMQSQDASGQVVRPMRLANSPRKTDIYQLQVGVLADSEDDYIHLLGLNSAAVEFDSFLGLMVCDTFDAVSGTTYVLSRAVGQTALTLPSIDYPTIITVDGTVDSGALTITGRNAVANSTGVIQCFYAPLFRMVISSMRQAFTDANKLELSLELTEVINAV